MVPSLTVQLNLGQASKKLLHTRVIHYNISRRGGSHRKLSDPPHIKIYKGSYLALARFSGGYKLVINKLIQSCTY